MDVRTRQIDFPLLRDWRKVLSPRLSQTLGGKSKTPSRDALHIAHTCGDRIEKLVRALSGPIRDTPPIAQYPFEIVSQRGVSHAFCPVFIGYRASIAEIPLLCGGGISHLHFACSPRGNRSEKGEGVSHPIGHVETPKAP